MQRQPLIIAGVIALLAIGLLVVSISHNQREDNKATIHIVTTTPDTINLSGTIDDNSEPLVFDGKGTSADVYAGSHKVTVTKPGYSSFSTTIEVNAKEDVYIRATLNRTSQPTLSSLPSATSKEDAKVTLQSVSYYGQHDWALANVQDSYGGAAVMILHYDDTSKTWEIMSGPSTSLASDEVKQYPADLRQFLRQNNYVVEGQS